MIRTTGPGWWLLALVIAAVSAGWAGAQKPRNYVAELHAEAESLLRDKKAVEAGVVYRKLLFAEPRDSRARKQLASINKDLAASLLELAKEAASDPERNIELLRKAARVDPDNKAVKSAFGERDYEFYAGEWRSVAESEKYKEADRERGETRRKDLGLGTGFRVVRQSVFRMYTDLSGGKFKVDQMLASIRTHYAAYCDLMRPLQVRYPDEGIDVVFFQKREDYIKRTESSDTLGLYVPEDGASYFYLTGAGEDFKTLLHEMTHQFCDKVSKMEIDSACISEGIAEYFGAAQLTNGGKKLELGRPHAYSVKVLRDALAGREGRLLGIETFLEVEEPTGDTFYPHSWGLFHYLMNGAPNGRLVLYDVLAAASINAEVRGSARPRTIAGVLSRYGSSAVELEAAMKEYYVKLR